MTAPNTSGSGCREKAGFLFSHVCRFDPVGTCSRCQKTICERHTFGGDMCITCGKKGNSRRRGASGAKVRHRDDDLYDNPYFYSGYYYHGYGYYGVGYWGNDTYDTYTPNDYNDFSEADGSGLVEGDADFEDDMGAS